MALEYDALQRQGTWSLVHIKPDSNAVGCKWVFKLKQRSDGTIERYKARLIAKGFHQQPEMDYGEMFSPVVKHTTVQLVLSIAIQFGWPIHQLDVYNAFLHGVLSEELCMEQLQGMWILLDRLMCTNYINHLWAKTSPAGLVS